MTERFPTKEHPRKLELFNDWDPRTGILLVEEKPIEVPNLTRLEIESSNAKVVVRSAESKISRIHSWVETKDMFKEGAEKLLEDEQKNLIVTPSNQSLLINEANQDNGKSEKTKPQLARRKLVASISPELHQLSISANEIEVYLDRFIGDLSLRMADGFVKLKSFRGKLNVFSSLGGVIEIENSFFEGSSSITIGFGKISVGVSNEDLLLNAQTLQSGDIIIPNTEEKTFSVLNEDSRFTFNDLAFGKPKRSIQARFGHSENPESDLHILSQNARIEISKVKNGK